ncbi:MAG: acetyl-CoA decarbonylase/synthase complex subunit delta [Desulfobacterota bacterium]|nr:acetyl-CoA decarbonylase/synthase complex subunit delta [Thermodesulfobacteriota bacterium]
MQLSDFFEPYKGEIKELLIGSPDKAVKIGGEKTLPFHAFEGQEGAPVRFALEVFDTPPEGWPEHLREPFADVLSDPIAWANKCLKQYGADLISLYLASLDSENADIAKIAENVKRMADQIPAPLIVMGVGDKDKDAKALVEIAKVCSGKNLLLGPLVKENYEEIAKAALEGGHAIIPQSPLDINLCKELNVKLTKFFPKEKIVVDPMSAAVGYGIDYSFSIMERVKQVGVIHNDEMMKVPIIANIGKECWKTKEAKEDKTQGVLWEALTAFTLILAGANLVVMRHPESLKQVKKLTS